MRRPSTGAGPTGRASRRGIPGRHDTTTLEDGVSRNHAPTGFGTGLAYAGGAAVDDTTIYSSRYQQCQITLAPVGPLVDGNYASFTVDARNVATMLLSDARGQQYTGLSTAFANNTRPDPEAIRVAPDGTVWASDEYGPAILHFDRDGHQIGALTLPPGFAVANPGPTAAFEAANNTASRTTNRGAEGLAISPDGRTLVVMMQSAPTQDGGLNSRARGPEGVAVRPRIAPAAPDSACPGPDRRP